MLGSVSAITRYDLSLPMVEFDLEANRKGYIGPAILRPRLVGIQAADVGKIPPNQLISAGPDTTRASGSGYKRSDFEMDKYSYSTQEHGFESAIDDRQVAIYGGILNAEEIHSSRTQNFVLEDFERACVAACINTGTFTGALTGAVINGVWSTHATATPVDDIHKAMEGVRTNSGLEPNLVEMNALAFWHAMNTTQVIDRVKYTKTATMAELAGLLAGVLGIKRLVVAGMPEGGWKNTANQANTTPTFARIWPDATVFVGRVAESDDPQEPCFGRSFIWNGAPAGGEAPTSLGDDQELALIMEEYRDEKVRGNVLRARTDWDIQIMYANAAYNLTGVL
ncbi:MAG: hypothetical protein KGL39_26210 [Patescibacteria group bacterium]|nr:hypothetical protein [Patescibacteria group bacterium]